MGDATKRFKVSFEVEVYEDVIDEFGLTTESMVEDVRDAVSEFLVRSEFIHDIKVEAV